MEKIKDEYDAAEEQLRQRKIEFGWIDQHTITDTSNANGGPGVDRRF